MVNNGNKIAANGKKLVRKFSKGRNEMRNGKKC